MSIAKKNCWEIKNCGKEVICPAGTCKEANGIHGGNNAGRCCWVLSETFCDGKFQESFATKIQNCMHCEVYLLVNEEEGKNFIKLRELFVRLKNIVHPKKIGGK